MLIAKLNLLPNTLFQIFLRVDSTTISKKKVKFHCMLLAHGMYMIPKLSEFTVYKSLSAIPYRRITPPCTSFKEKGFKVCCSLLNKCVYVFLPAADFTVPRPHNVYQLGSRSLLNHLHRLQRNDLQVMSDSIKLYS